MGSSGMTLRPDAGPPSPANSPRRPKVTSPSLSRGGPRAGKARGGRKPTWSAQDLLAALESDLGEVDLDGCTVDIGRDGLCLTTGYWTLVNGTIRGGTLALAAGVRNVAFRRVTFAGPGGSAATLDLKTEAEREEAMRHGVVEVAGARDVAFEECVFGDFKTRRRQILADIKRTGEYFCSWLPGLSVHGSSAVRVRKTAFTAQRGPGLYASGKCRVSVTDLSSFVRNTSDGVLAEDGAVLHLSEVLAAMNFGDGVRASGAKLKAHFVVCEDNIRGIRVHRGGQAKLDHCALFNSAFAGLFVSDGGSNVTANDLQCKRNCKRSGDDLLGVAVDEGATCTVQGGEIELHRAAEVRSGGVLSMTDVSVGPPGGKTDAVGPCARDGGRLCLTRVKIRGVQGAIAALGRGSVVVAEAVECHNVCEGVRAGGSGASTGGTAELRDCVFDGCDIALVADGGGHVRSENAKIAGSKATCASAIAEGRVDVRGGEVWCEASATVIYAEGEGAKVTATDVTWTGSGQPATCVTGGAEVVVAP